MALRAEPFLHLVGELDVIRTCRKPYRLEIEHAAGGDRPFDEGRWQAKILLPVGGQQYAHQMSARGMTTDIKTISVTAEGVGVLVSPGNRAPYLVGHHQEVATSLDHIVEIRNDEIRTGIDEHLGRVMVVARKLHAPGTTMNMDMHGRLRCLCGKN